MRTHLDAAKSELRFVLQRRLDADDLSGFLGLDTDRFERLVQLVEDLDPHWLAEHLRDPSYSLGARAEMAAMMRGPTANALILELLR